MLVSNYYQLNPFPHYTRLASAERPLFEMLGERKYLKAFEVPDNYRLTRLLGMIRLVVIYLQLYAYTERVFGTHKMLDNHSMRFLLIVSAHYPLEGR